jgi:hypothetical protein
VQHTHSANPESVALDRGQNLPGDIPGYGIRFDNCERTFELAHKKFCILSPISAGEAHTATPAPSSALILSEALPDPPEMIAPA